MRTEWWLIMECVVLGFKHHKALCEFDEFTLLTVVVFLFCVESIAHALCCVSVAVSRTAVWTYRPEIFSSGSDFLSLKLPCLFFFLFFHFLPFSFISVLVFFPHTFSCHTFLFNLLTHCFFLLLPLQFHLLTCFILISFYYNLIRFSFHISLSLFSFPSMNELLISLMQQFRFFLLSERNLRQLTNPLYFFFFPPVTFTTYYLISHEQV